MKFTSEVVDELALKLLIGLSKEENEMVLSEFESIDEKLNLLNKIEGINEVEPMTHCLDDFEFELRNDVVKESVKLEDLLKNSDETNGREIEVPKVVG